MCWAKVDALLKPFLHPSYIATMNGQSGVILVLDAAYD